MRVTAPLLYLKLALANNSNFNGIT